MKINSYLLLSLLGLVSVPAAHAMEELTQGMAHMGLSGKTAITAATLPAFVAENQLPAEQRVAVEEFFTKHGEIVERWTNDQLPERDVLGYEFPNDLEALRAVSDANKRALTRHGITNKANLNLVAISPQVVIRASHLLYRKHNRDIQQGHRRGQLHSVAETNAHAASHSTYQTASMAVIAKTLRDIIKEEGIDGVSVPQTWPVAFKKEGSRLVIDDQPKDAGIYPDIDDKYIIIAQQIFSGKNPVSLRENPGRLADIDDKTFSQWLQLTVRGGLWNSVDKIHITDDNKLELASVQQPDNSNPDHFFHQDQKKVEWNTTVGFEQIADFCVAQKDAHKLKMVQEFVTTQVVPTMQHHGDYLKNQILAKQIA